MRTAKNVITFEPKGIARLIREAPAEKRAEYRLRQPTGGAMDKLILVTLGNGRASWFLRYDTGHGRARDRKRLKLGDHNSPLPGIRQRWLDALAAIGAGGDPVGDKAAGRLQEAERATWTVAKLIEEYTDAKTKAGTRSVAEIKRVLVKDVALAIGTKPVAAVTALDLEAITERIAGRGSPVAARMALVIASGMFKWALGTARWRQAGLTADPAAMLAKPKPPAPRTRKLTDAELRAFWSVLNAGSRMAPATADAFRFGLLMAGRADEVQSLAWAELELERPDPLWRLPASRAKNGRETLFPLPPSAVALLRRRQAENFARTHHSAYVFPGTGPNDVPLTEGVLRTALRRLFESAVESVPPVLTCPRFSPHDLRRTCAHRLSEELDFSSEMIAAYLGQVSSSVTDRHYAQGSRLQRLRRLAKSWDAHLMRIVGGQIGDNVILLRVSEA